MRDLRKLLALRRWALLAGLTCTALAGCGPSPDHGGYAGPYNAPLTMHVLNRLAFGPSPGDVQAIRNMGVDAWIDSQLSPDTIPESQDLSDRLSSYQTLALDPVTLFEDYGPPRGEDGVKPAPDAVKAARQRARIIVREASEARLARAVWSQRQLQEVMVDFWYNHFNVFAEKGLDHLWVGNYEVAAIRPNALGHFRDLLEATAKHPAMLFYLDNDQNAAPGSPAGRDKNGNPKETGLNENYARELMELHTLGVNGGYSQDDVISLARILTGWGIARPRNAEDGSGFRFYPRRHDDTEKTFLGQDFPAGGGQDEIERALDMLAASPATAHHLSFELAQYFVADDPPPALVDRLTQRWIETNGDIAQVLRTLFFSPEFRDPKNFGVKFKTPLEYVASSLRAADMPVTNFKPVLGTLLRLGEMPYFCQTPDGYKNTRDAWLNPDAMTLRVSFATGLGAGRMKLNQTPVYDDAGNEVPPAPGDMVPPAPLDAGALMSLLGPELSAHTIATVAASPKQLQAALILGGPDFMVR